MQALWAPLNEAVHQLTPPEFDYVASREYAQLGSPAVHINTFWDIYLNLLHAIQHGPNPSDVIPDLAQADIPQSEARVYEEHSRTPEAPAMHLLQGLLPMRFGHECAGPQHLPHVHYVGGLPEPPALESLYTGANRMDEERLGKEAAENIDNTDSDEEELTDEERLDEELDPEQLYAPLTDFRD
jgi:hypothetical protein